MGFQSEINMQMLSCLIKQTQKIDLKKSVYSAEEPSHPPLKKVYMTTFANFC